MLRAEVDEEGARRKDEVETPKQGDSVRRASEKVVDFISRSVRRTWTTCLLASVYVNGDGVLVC